MYDKHSEGENINFPYVESSSNKATPPQATGY